MDNDSKLYGALAYFLGLITGVVMLVVKPKDDFVKFHAMQSIFLNIVLVVLMILISVVYGLISAMFMFISTKLSGIFFLLFNLFQLVISLIFLGLWLFLMWKAYQGEKFKLPLLGDQAEKMAGSINK